VDEAKPFKIPKREIWAAFKRVKANQGAAGVDGQSIAAFEANLSGNLYKLWNRMSSGSYFPPPVRRVDIPKAGGGTRPLGIPTAARDFDDAKEIAEPGWMRLYLCDIALERARLAFARIEAFAPLNGLTDDSPPKPKSPTKAERKSLHDEAVQQLAIAADYITKCGYHRRDEELAELEAVLRGERRFADLPPRV
jgi:hypothetical protein